MKYLREIGFSIYILPSFYSALSNPPSLPQTFVCKVFCLSFASIKALLFVFKVFTFRSWGEQVGQSPLLSVGMLGAPAGSQGEKYGAWMLSLQEPLPASLSWFWWYDSLPQCACLKFPDLNKRGLGDQDMGKGNSALILELPLLLKQELHMTLRPAIPLSRATEGGKGGMGNFTDCLMFFFSQRVCYRVFREVRWFVGEGGD